MNEENKAPSPAPAQKSEAQKLVEGILSADPKKLEPNAAVKLDPNLVQKPIRTFESDLAEALAKKQGSAAAISIAESKRKEEAQRAEEIKQAPVQTREPVRPGPAPVAPTRATAIPGATILIPPEVPREALGAQAEITATIREAQPKPVPPKPAPVPPPPTMPVIKPITPPQATPQPTITPAPAPVSRSSILKPILLTFMSLVLLSGGIFAGYYIYTNLPIEEEIIPEPIVIPSILPQDGQMRIDTAGEAGNQLVSKIYAAVNATGVSDGQIKEFRIYQKQGDASYLMTSSTFWSKLDTNMPAVMQRSLTDHWMFGVYGEETGQKTSFVALTTDFFQNALAGMLSWEKDDMADNLALLLNFKDKAVKEDPNSTSTISSYFSIRGDWSDKVIRNRDVREFRTPTGDLLFLYAFINKKTLLITTTESSFIALVDRVEKEAYVR